MKRYAPQSRNYTLYNLPNEWARLIAADGMKVATYAKIAIVEKVRRDGGALEGLNTVKMRYNG
ncbi:MAG: hypothetical protein LBP89_07130 [Helicobacteraceae bacterium]|nr:hypothetical protein [Helicobacteraceae bacterium]